MKPTLDPRARRILFRRKAKRFALALVLVAFVAIVVASRSTGTGLLATDRARFHQKHCRVVEVIEGDTLRVSPGGGGGAAVTVKLLGVDADAAPAARDFTRSICGETVLLYLQDVPTRDHAGNLLAYVFLPDGTLLNQTLVTNGLAYADRRFDYPYRATFVQAEEAASRKRVGLWADDAHDDTMPGWRKRWLAEVRKKPWERREWVRADEP